MVTFVTYRCRYTDQKTVYIISYNWFVKLSGEHLIKTNDLIMC